MTDVVNRFAENQEQLVFNVPPTFDTIEAERRHRKERLAGALRIFGKLYGVAGVEARIGELAGQLDLVEFLDRPTGKLSAGQKTRVSLAKSLLNEPEILLLYGRRLRDASDHSTRSKPLGVRGTDHCQGPKDRGEV